MKKFQFAAGLAALAMLGACSNDMPEVVGTVDNDNEGMMYLTLNVVGADKNTRAVGDELEGGAESLIQCLSLVVYDETENVILTAECNDVTGGVGIFPVSAQQFTELEEAYNNTNEIDDKNVRILVTANCGDDFSDDAVDMLHGSTTGPTWGIDNTGGIKGKNTIDEVDCFMMSNAEECHVLLGKQGADGKSKATAWKIAADIKLARMSTRFEYGNAANSTFTAQHEGGLKMTLAGIDVETHANSVYYIPTFTANGYIPDGGLSINNHSHYESTSDFPYRVTEVVSPTTLKNYPAYNYNFLNGTNIYGYANPNTVSNKDGWKLNTEDARENYRKIPFAAIRVRFESTDFAGTGAPSKSMEAGDDVLAVGGIFIGGVKDYFTLKDAGKTLVIDYDKTEGVFSEAEIKVITDLQDKYNDILKMAAPSEKNEVNGTSYVKGGAEDEAWFKEKFVGKDVYSPRKQNGSPVANPDGSYTYYTYYSKLIQHNGSAADFRNKYGVSRNTSYALSVSSIKYLGGNSGKTPGEGPTKADFSELYIKLNVEVKNWSPNIVNQGWKL